MKTLSFIVLLAAGLNLATSLQAAQPSVQSAPSPAALPARSAAAPVSSPRLVEPHLRISPSGNTKRPRIALTFDACMGKADHRILSTLIEQKIPATIFVTGRWLHSNPETVASLLAHPDLFELENHGENHIPAVDVPVAIYGIPAAGSPAAVEKEVRGGAEAMRQAGLASPQWFRGSTARYDLSAIRQIRAMGYRIAGYSVNGDGGSLLGAALTEKRITTAKDGDVVIAHINQPTHEAGEGVARALVALKARNVEFVRLSDTQGFGDDETTR